MRWYERKPIQMTAIVIPSPIEMRMMSSSSNPIQISAMLSAGTKFDIGIGSGRERNADEKMMPSPHRTWDVLEFAQG